MKFPCEFRFGPFRMDVRDQRLWHGTEPIALRPKTFAVLRHLLEDAGRLVAKEALLERVWPGVIVSDNALTACLRELRRALDDDPRQPRYIETAHRRGYRFIAPVLGPGSTSDPVAAGPAMVGRDLALGRLHAWLDEAHGGGRRLVFVAGEAGLGKTTLLDAFLEAVAATKDWSIARGECIEHHGSGEAYLPVLSALGRLARTAGGPRLVELLRQHAPAWLVQMPALLPPAEREAVRERVADATPSRMLREIAEALEAITAERPLVLALEDLHWSDHATLDLLAFLGRRREPARLMLVGTYRPVEAIVRAHPLRAVTRDLALHGQCAELALELLTEAEVARYLRERLGSAAELDPLAAALHRRTDGHPLFVVSAVDMLIRQGVATAGRLDAEAAVAALAREVPDTLRHFIEHQVERLDPGAQRLLEAASVAGVEWSVAAVAAGLSAELEAVEARCADLARRGPFLVERDVEDWPDGTVAGRYAFRHALYRDAVYARVPSAERMRLHRRIAERMEAGYGERAAERAAELALHFEHGRDDGRAVRYLRHAARRSMERWAHQEAARYLTAALTALKRLPGSGARTREELDLLLALGPALITSEGQGAASVRETFERARDLAGEFGEAPQLFLALHGLRRFHMAHNEHEAGREIGHELLRVARQQGDRALLMEAHFALGLSLFYLGELATAHDHLVQGSACDDGRGDPSHVLRYGLDTGLLCVSYAGLTSWLLGFPERAHAWTLRAVARAHDQPHALSRVIVLLLAATLALWRGHAEGAKGYAESAQALAREHGLPFWALLASILRGSALASLGQGVDGIALMRHGLETSRATSQVNLASYTALLAEGYLRTGQVADGLALIGEFQASVPRPGYLYRSELERLKGELLLRSGPRRDAEAEACFRGAIDAARAIASKALELRATISLARLWRRHGRRQHARRALAMIHGWFTEGFDTADLREASALLRELDPASR